MFFSCQAWSTCADVRERVCMRQRDRETEKVQRLLLRYFHSRTREHEIIQ
jgi:hypothetical protein